MESANKKRLTTLHVCPLVNLGSKILWVCDGRFQPKGCRSKGKNMIRWRCDECDFDLCETCCDYFSVTQHIIEALPGYKRLQRHVLITDSHRHPLSQFPTPKSPCSTCKKPKDLWCSICTIEFCRACLGGQQTFVEKDASVDLTLDSIIISQTVMELSRAKSEAEKLNTLD